MDDVDEARVARVEAHRRGHALEVGLGRVQPSDATQPRDALARVARCVRAQAVPNHVHLTGVQTQVLLRRNDKQRNYYFSKLIFRKNIFLF